MKLKQVVPIIVVLLLLSCESISNYTQNNVNETSLNAKPSSQTDTETETNKSTNNIISERPGKVNAISVKNNNVYTAGYIKKMNQSYACYWINTKLFDLQIRGEVTSIVIEDDNIYMSGRFFDKKTRKYKACYWKNDKLIILPGKATIAYGIAIDNNQIYNIGIQSPRACYWENNKQILLPGFNATAKSIEIKNSNIYIAGDVSAKACYWVNSALKLLPDGYQAYDIVIDNKNILIAGESNDDYSAASYWQNNKITKLERGSAKAIDFQNNTVYITGWHLDSSGKVEACYWKGKKIFPLSGKYSEATSITVHNNSIYIGGTSIYKNKKEIPCYWENNVLHYLETGTK